MSQPMVHIQNLHLEDVVDITTLQRIQDTFAQAMGFASVTVNKGGRPITRKSKFVPFCHLIRSTGRGRARCWECDAVQGLESYKSGRSQSYICHAGLVDVAAPIVIEGEHIGSVLCGQVIPSDSQEEFIERIIERNADLRIPRDELVEATQEIPSVPWERLEAAVEMLRLTANHIAEIGVASFRQTKLLEEMQEKAALQAALHSAQLRALETQINPHFLFNSLTLISYTAIQENASQTEEIAYCLSDLLHYSLRNIALMVTLDQELDMLERYLTIQTLRFGSRLKVRMDIEPSLRQVQIPCMLLQPLVENVIIHAVEPLPRPVTVQIRASRRPTGMSLEVLDDGPGMDMDIVKSINSRTFTDNDEGRISLGLQNVIQRLMGEYGDKSFVRVESSSKCGTRILLFLPIRS